MMREQRVGKEQLRIYKVAQLTGILLLVGLILYFGFLLRYAPVLSWSSEPDRYISEGEPVLLNLDGYYYLNVAREFQQKSWSEGETHRGYPDTIVRSSVPPLPGVLLVGVSRLTGWSLDQAAVVLPCVLSLLAAIPLFYLGFRCGGFFSGVVATILFLAAPLSVTRNSYGFFDTDCLNSFFSLAAICFALLFGTVKSLWRYLFFLFSLVSLGFYLWWWDQSFAPPTVLALTPLLLSLLVFYRPVDKKEIGFFSVFFLGIFAVILFNHPELPMKLWKSVYQELQYISKWETELYPNVGITIEEQNTLDPFMLFDGMFKYKFLFWCSTVGVFLLMWKRKKEFLLFMPLVIVGLFSFSFANRFVIFIVPIFCLGLGFFFSELIAFLRRYLQKIIWYYVLVSLTFILVCWISFSNSMFLIENLSNREGVSAREATGMKLIDEVTEKNALIWSWWDEGHPLIYYADRDTVNDGMVHKGIRNFCTALPLVSQNDRFVANFMNFYAAQGIAGYQTIEQEIEKYGFDIKKFLFEMLTAGPEKAETLFPKVPLVERLRWVDFLYPISKKPIYLFLTRRTVLHRSFWINFYGRWDAAKKTSDPGLLSFHLNVEGDGVAAMEKGVFPLEGELTIFPESGSFLYEKWLEKPVQLESLFLTTFSKTKRISSNLPYHGLVQPQYQAKVSSWLQGQMKKTGRYRLCGDYVLDISLPYRMLLLQDKNRAEALYSRLFWRTDDYDPRWLTPVERTPDYQLWRVNGDMAKME